MSSPTPKRPKIPYDVQVKVFFRDKWLCWLCGRPTAFAPALKLIKHFVEITGNTQPTAYWSHNFRRDSSPLLDELAAVVDHVKAHAGGGPSHDDNLKTACNKCNMRKSSADQATFTERNPKRRIKSRYGEPLHWDGFVSLFMVLATANQRILTDSEKAWFRAFEKFFVEAKQGSEAVKQAAGATR
jgi:5-methylcytosine-specific restriction endonuclease McrA